MAKCKIKFSGFSVSLFSEALAFEISNKLEMRWSKFTSRQSKRQWMPSEWKKRWIFSDCFCFSDVFLTGLFFSAIFLLPLVGQWIKSLENIRFGLIHQRSEQQAYIHFGKLFESEYSPVCCVASHEFEFSISSKCLKCRDDCSDYWSTHCSDGASEIILFFVELRTKKISTKANVQQPWRPWRRQSIERNKNCCVKRKQTCIIAAGPEFMPDMRKSSGSLSYGGSSYQCPWCGRLIAPRTVSSYMYVSSVPKKRMKMREKTNHKSHVSKWLN